MEPEKAHRFTLRMFSMLTHNALGRGFIRDTLSASYHGPPIECFGLQFPNPVGLAAGFDKDAEYIDELSMLGFGFIEVGTVTPLPQSGNIQPRLFRLPKDRALINRMGFNNEGVNAMARRLSERKSDVIVGANIGKNKRTSNSDAYKDYIICFEKLAMLVDYFVVNVSSPNTPGLRELQDKKPLSFLLNSIQTKNRELAQPLPVLLKISPDLKWSELDDILAICMDCGIDGIIATNTTTWRENISSDIHKVESYGSGGLSGFPLNEKSNTILKQLVKKSEGKMPIIGVGGIQRGKDAYRKLKMGASLVQVYTGFVYKGPDLLKEIFEVLEKEGLPEKATV